MTKVEAATAVATKLLAAEDAVDTAMIRHTQLLEQMVEARKVLGVSATTGELAQVRVCDAIAALSEAHRAVMAAHAALASVEKKMDLRVSAGLGDKPEEEPKRPNVDLRAVS